MYTATPSDGRRRTKPATKPTSLGPAATPTVLSEKIATAPPPPRTHPSDEPAAPIAPISRAVQAPSPSPPRARTLPWRKSPHQEEQATTPPPAVPTKTPTTDSSLHPPSAIAAIPTTTSTKPPPTTPHPTHLSTTHTLLRLLLLLLPAKRNPRESRMGWREWSRGGAPNCASETSRAAAPAPATPGARRVRPVGMRGGRRCGMSRVGGRRARVGRWLGGV